MPVSIERHRVRVAGMFSPLSGFGVELDVLASGPPSAPLVIFLHGFPDCAGLWRPELMKFGRRYRVLAPDQRGYAGSSKPSGVAPYILPRLVRDIEALIDWAGHEQATVVGHDWGAFVAWRLAATRPRRVRAFASLSVPHPRVMAEFRRSDPEQRKKSLYIRGFQVPILPERRLAREDFAALQRALTAASRPGAFTPEDLSEHLAAWRKPGALTGMLNWYRAMLLFPPEQGLGLSTVRPPGLILWGQDDPYLSWRMVEPSVAACEQAEALVIPGAGHWLQRDQPEVAHKRLGAFLDRHAGAPI